MTQEDLRAAAHRIVERMVVEHRGEAALLASLVLSELFEATLFADDDEAAVGAFVAALASVWGTGGHGFKSRRPDHLPHNAIL